MPVTAGDVGLTQASVLAAADTSVRQTDPNLNYGKDELLRVRSSGMNRALVQLDVSGVRGTCTRSSSAGPSSAPV